MEKINSQSYELKLLYSEVRQLEKKISVLMQEFQQQHFQCVNSVSKSVESRIKIMKRIERETIELLDQTKKSTMSTVNQSWENFQKYAQEIRKIYLGGANSQKIPPFKINTVRQHLNLLEQSKGKLYMIVEQMNTNLMKESNLSFVPIPKPRQIQSLNIVTSQSQRLIDKNHFQPSFQMSPIKKKGNLQNLLPEKDNISIKIQTPFKSQLVLHKDELLSNKKSTAMYKELVYKNVNFQNSARKNEQFMYHSPKHNEYAHSDLKVNLNKELRQPGDDIFTMRSNKTRLSKVKSEQKIESGYKNCLQILQKQQLKYDKIKYGSG